MRLQVFLIEDDPVILENLSFIMSDVLNAQVVGSAQTADDALSWLATHEDPDLIVLDLFLREGTGFTVLSRTSHKQHGRCVVLTNSATPAKTSLCFALGAAAVFDKTLQIDEFLKYCALLPAFPAFP